MFVMTVGLSVEPMAPATSSAADPGGGFASDVYRDEKSSDMLFIHTSHSLPPGKSDGLLMCLRPAQVSCMLRH